jgi:hypothetical protein
MKRGTPEYNKRKEMLAARRREQLSRTPTVIRAASGKWIPAGERKNTAS